MRKGFLVVVTTVLLFLGVASAAPPECSIAGTWYGGSVVAYHMAIIPTAQDDQYAVYVQPMFSDGSAKSTVYTGTLVKKGTVYEGSIMQMTGGEAFAVAPPTYGLMPDLNVAWVSMKLTDCNTISNTIPFFGTYFANTAWNAPQTILVNPPDVDLLHILTNDQPVLETYHRVPTKVNPALRHQ